MQIYVVLTWQLIAVKYTNRQARYNYQLGSVFWLFIIAAKVISAHRFKFPICFPPHGQTNVPWQ